MKLKELLKNVEIIDAKNENPELNIDMVYYNSRKVKEGGLFVAIDGYEVDGHDYIEDAISRGAVAILVTKDVDFNVPTYKTENNRKALSILSNNYYGHPSDELKVFGITASNGKTSTSMMLNAILEANNIQPGLLGTVMYKVGDEEVASKLTTPESLELQGIFKSMLDEGIDTCVMEVSSVGQEMFRVGGIDFDIVCMNNITREHIDQHGSFEKYFEEKQKTITNASEDAFAIINIEDEYAKSLIPKTKAKVITFSDQDSSADVYAENKDISSGFGKFDLVLSDKFTGKEQRKTIKLNVAGYQSIVNALSAAAMAASDGIDIDTIAKGLENYRGIERRFEQIYDDEFKILDDHFANIENINMTLQTLSKMDYKNAVILYAIRGNRGVTVNGENAETFLKWKDKLKLKSLLVTKSTEIVEDHDFVHPDEEAIFKEKMDGVQEYTLYDELGEALDSALDQVEEGDVLLLAGCQGMDYGGKLILDRIAGRYPEKDKKELYKPLENRIAGMDK